MGDIAYFAMKPPEVVTVTQPTTTAVTTIITQPTTTVVTTTVPTTTATTITTGKPTVTIWWEKGYYAEEDKAMWEIFYESQKNYNVELDVSFYPSEDLQKNLLQLLTLRYFPVYKDVLGESFWTTGFTDSGRKDPHIPMVYKQLTIGDRRPYPYDLHPAASRVQVENWWGKAIHRVVLDGKTPEEAIDEQIAYVKSEYGKW